MVGKNYSSPDGRMPSSGWRSHVLKKRLSFGRSMKLFRECKWKIAWKMIVRSQLVRTEKCSATTRLPCSLVTQCAHEKNRSHTYLMSSSCPGPLDVKRRNDNEKKNINFLFIHRIMKMILNHKKPYIRKEKKMAQKGSKSTTVNAHFSSIASSWYTSSCSRRSPICWNRA